MDELMPLMREFVSNYAKFDRISGCLDLSLHDIPETEFDRAVTLLLRDHDIASEATGPDNPAWEKYMVPAIYRKFRNPNADYVDMEMVEEWTNGIREYLIRYISPALDAALEEENHDKKLSNFDICASEPYEKRLQCL